MTDRNGSMFLQVALPIILISIALLRVYMSMETPFFDALSCASIGTANTTVFCLIFAITGSC